MDLQSIKPVFATAKVSSALLIDDAFDPLPDIEPDAFQAGFQLVEEDDAVETAYQAIGGAWPVDQNGFSTALTTDDALREQIEQALAGPADAPLGRLAQALFGVAAENHRAKIAPLQALCALLKQVGIEPTAIGSADKPKGRKKRFPLIFLDYYLGEDGLPSVDRSIEKIKDVLTGYPDDEKPIVVLMSSELRDENLADQFREKANLLGCQFKFVTKDKFTGAAFEFVSSLADRAEFIGQSRVLSEFVRSWRDALEGAIGAFEKEIKSLDLQDFYFIWEKAGEGKNNRFGEHLSSLFEGYLRKQIEDADALLTATEKVNKLSFSTMPPGPLVPSDTVARLAHAAAFRDIDPFPENYTGPPLGIDLGELFIRDRTIPAARGRKKARELVAMMVISQACDLEHGKVGTVLMVEGTVQLRTASTRDTNEEAHRRLRVDIFQYENGVGEKEDLIIEWDAQRLRTFNVDTFHKDMRAAGFDRVARLRPVHALAMQQKFAANLTRVGMPDALPAYRYGGMEVHVAGPGDNTLIRLMDPVPKADKPMCVVGEDPRRMVVTDPALERVRSALRAADPAQFAEGAIEALRTEFDDIKKLRRMRSCELQAGKRDLGAVLIVDGPLGDGFKRPAKVRIILSHFAP
ncbi:hypothetical protein ACFFF7_09325 [Novosphingobium aquiterrae]|uniref:Response receiver domain-containing protein n=1 Tax=Novosphingobium aquiterrae TaxID=624388 RepID=A0ABV6PKN9_9SPHN